MPASSIARGLDRRTLLTGGLAAAAGLLLSACSDTSGSTATSSATTSTAAASAAATATATAGGAAAAATTFAATLSSSQRSSLKQDYSLANAAKWSNLPQGLLQGDQARIGLQLSSLDDAQWAALGSLLKSVTGSGANEGWAEIQQLWNADDYLAAHGGGSSYGRGNYFIAFLGVPSDSGTWELQFGGHHLALSNTYVDGALAGATPSFRGVEPFQTFTLNGVTNKPLQQERAAFSAMLKGLSSSQLASAKLDAVYSDLVLGPGKDWAFPTAAEGVQVSGLSSAQRKLVLAAISTYVGDTDAATILAKYTDELDDTRIAWSGTTELTAQNDYARIDGPSVWIEFSMQRGIVLSGNHPHSVWRDRTTDYGGTKA
jgi:hypothetical protein